jgi:hypothetical protein
VSSEAYKDDTDTQRSGRSSRIITNEEISTVIGTTKNISAAQ